MDMPEIQIDPTQPTAEPQSTGDLIRMNAASQRKAQITALALEFHRTVSTRWCCAGIPENYSEAFALDEECAAFNAACEHLRNVFSGENE